MMQRYEYKVVPSPRKGEKSRAARTTPDRFALAMTTLMNRLALDGWEYLRADTLPCDERVGFTGSKTTFQSLLVFQRALDESQVLMPATASAATDRPEPLVGPAEAPEGAAPALGPAANPGLAAE